MTEKKLTAEQNQLVKEILERESPQRKVDDMISKALLADKNSPPDNTEG